MTDERNVLRKAKPDWLPTKTVSKGYYFTETSVRPKKFYNIDRQEANAKVENSGQTRNPELFDEDELWGGGGQHGSFNFVTWKDIFKTYILKSSHIG